MAAPLGRCAAATITVTNPLATEAAYAVSVEPAGGNAVAVEGNSPNKARGAVTRASSSASRTCSAGARGSADGSKRFSVSPAVFSLGPYVSTDLMVQGWAWRVKAGSLCSQLE